MTKVTEHRSGDFKGHGKDSVLIINSSGDCFHLVWRRMVLGTRQHAQKWSSFQLRSLTVESSSRQVQTSHKIASVLLPSVLLILPAPHCCFSVCWRRLRKKAGEHGCFLGQGLHWHPVHLCPC